MPEGIFLLQQNDELIEMVEQEYDSEDLLQKLLARFPSLIPGGQIDNDEPRRWLLISREMGVPCEEGKGNHWAIDHLFIDQDAIPTIVEVKRATDSRIRREVVGQILDYASNAVVYWSIENIRTRFEAACEERGTQPEDELQIQLGIEGDSEDFWRQVKTNLQAGKIRLILVADAIPAEVQRIVEFMNNQMDPAEMLALEIKQFVGEEMKTLVPRLIGKTAEAQQRKASSSRPKRPWDEESFLGKLSDEEQHVANRLLSWAKENNLRLSWGTGKRSGSFYVFCDTQDYTHYLFAAWTYGGVDVQFENFRPPFDTQTRKQEVYDRLMKIDGLSLPSDYWNRRPPISYMLLRDEENLNTFLETFDWMIEEIRKAESQ